MTELKQYRAFATFTVASRPFP